jgi:sugar phosphate isomerase/epimerase
MKDQDKSIGQVSRRGFLGAAAAAAGAISIMPLAASGRSLSSGAKFSSPVSSSEFASVQIGTITYSFRDLEGGVENVLKACVESGVRSIELMPQGIETYLGAPEAPEGIGGFRGPPPPGFQRKPLTAEQQAARDRYNKELKAWRLSVPMSKYESMRKMFNDAGVNIHIVKFQASGWSSDEEIDYAFKAAKALGAKGICEELNLDAAKKLGPIAAKNGMYIIFHNHMQFAEPGFSYDPFMAISPAVMFNFDAGHFFGSTGLHPNTIIDKYHDRIISVHLKDKTGPNTTPPNTNQVWGQGEMPMEDVLLNIRDKKYPIHCDIELEYDVPPWSNSVKEVNTCLKYARQILLCM